MPLSTLQILELLKLLVKPLAQDGDVSQQEVKGAIRRFSLAIDTLRQWSDHGAAQHWSEIGQPVAATRPSAHAAVGLNEFLLDLHRPRGMLGVIYRILGLPKYVPAHHSRRRLGLKERAARTKPVLSFAPPVAILAVFALLVMVAVGQSSAPVLPDNFRPGPNPYLKQPVGSGGGKAAAIPTSSSPTQPATATIATGGGVTGTATTTLGVTGLIVRAALPPGSAGTEAAATPASISGQTTTPLPETTAAPTTTDPPTTTAPTTTMPPTTTTAAGPANTSPDSTGAADSGSADAIPSSATASRPEPN